MAKRNMTSVVVALIVATLTSCGGGNAETPNFQATIDAAVRETQSAVSGGSTAPTETPSTSIISAEGTPTAQLTSGAPTVTTSTTSFRPRPLSAFLGYLISAVLSGENSVREGYRLVELRFYMQNTSDKLFGLGFSLNYDPLFVPVAPFPGVRTTIVAAGEFEYQCGMPVLPPTFQAYGGSWIPPNFGYPSQTTCEVPNTATDLSLKLAEFASGAAFFTLSLSDNPIYNEMPSLADFSRDYPTIGDGASIEGLADIQLTSAQYDSVNASWKVTLQIKNLYGYDILPNYAQVEVLSDSGFYQPELTGAVLQLIPDIPPGLEKAWEFTIQGDASPSTVLFFGLTYPPRFGVPGYVIFRLGQP